jgi:probable F420-dependent oxidoreductase
MTANLGRFGIWSSTRQWRDSNEMAEAAAELDQLGITALWLGGANGDLQQVRTILGASQRMAVATGIVNIWQYSAPDVAASTDAVNRAYPGRFLLGVGVGHAPSTEAMGLRYERPYEKMVEYLDALDAAPTPVAREDRALAALGPRLLKLSAERSAGAHPYLVNPEHTASARSVMGAGPLLAPDQKVVLESDPTRAREIARKSVSLYLRLPNYTNNLRRLGFADEDLAEPGSDRLVDSVVVWGGVDAMLARVKAHHDAGADHVCVNVVTDTPNEIPRAQWREVAQALAGA